MKKVKEKFHSVLVRANMLRLLSKGFSYPHLHNQKMIKSIVADLVEEEHIPPAIRAYLLELKDLLCKDQRILLEYSRLFLNKSFPLCESSCCNKRGAISEALDLYNSFGLTDSSEDTADNLSEELEFAALLLMKTSASESRSERTTMEDAYTKFFREHLHHFGRRVYEKILSIETIRFYTILNQLMSLTICYENKLLNKKDILSIR